MRIGVGCAPIDGVTVHPGIRHTSPRFVFWKLLHLKQKRCYVCNDNYNKIYFLFMRRFMMKKEVLSYNFQFFIKTFSHRFIEYIIVPGLD